MEKRKNKTRLARAAMTLLFALLATVGAWAETVTFDFEDNQIPGDWTNDDNYPWVVVSESQGNGHTGTYCIKSGNSGVSSSESSIEATFTFVGDGSISFLGGCWGEGSSTLYDKCIFYIDGVEKFSFGARDTWETYSFEVEAGEHTFKWSFTKDSSVNGTGDAFFVDDIVIDLGVASACSKPKNLNVTTEGQTATVTWDGSADYYNIDINGTVTNNVTSPYTFNVELSTKYTVKVQASCGEGETSDWSNPLSFTTPDCIGGHVIEYTGNAINVVEGCGNVIATLTIENGNKNSGTLSLCSDYYELIWKKGSYPGEASFTFTVNGSVIYSNQSGSSLSDGQVLHTIGTSTTPAKPTGLAAGTPGTHEVALTWAPGNSETAWQICLDNDESNIINIDNANSTINEGTVSYTLTGLTADTEYSVMVRAFIDNDTQSCWSAPVTFTTAPTCPKPTNLVAGSIDTHSAVLSWTEKGEADQWQICINGDESNLIAVNENPFTLTNLDPETAYSVKVRAYCSAEDQSSWSAPVTFTTAPTCPKPTDLAAGTPEAHEVELSWTENGEAEQWQICVNGDETNLLLVNVIPYTLKGLAGDTEYSVKVRAYCSIDDQSNWTNPVTFTTAEACPKPTNLAETNITTNSATLSWEGYNDSYVLQYRPWNPAGDDIITTGTLTTYTVDLSQYEGTGSVAIRHYDISDMFQLIVDNIEVTNAAGTVVYSQDFEDCGGNMPAEFSNMDLDGDGYMWGIASSPSSNVDGSYGIVSASYDNYAGALTPDNWLILSGIEMGGQMTFQARGQDPAYAAENFAIYVSTENSIVEVPVTATTYNATDLTPNTPYAWQVKGVCSEVNESRFVSSFFKTKDDMLVFATDGNWNDVANWKDAEGNTATVLPTNVNNVRIDAAAVIPAGYVACANKATIGTGSITIKDGGQLKQNAATLRVTMEKEIAGYGENDGNYYFIASPFNGRTLYSESGSFSIVNNMLTDEYDLNAFDAAASDGLEWINYKSEPQTHNAFIAENGLAGLLYSEGYLYANQEGTTLEFIGTTGKSNNYSESRDFTYDDSSSDVFNGWKLIGNPFTCNGYVTYSGDATFYKMNGDGLEAFENGVVLAPGEGAFIKVSASGTITFSSEAPEGFTSTSTTAAGILPILPLHGLTTNVDANGEDILFAKEGYATYYNGKYEAPT